MQLLGSSTDALLKLLGIPTSHEPDITEDEIKAMIRQGADSGLIEEAEHDMVQRVLRLGDRTVKTLMTPRTEICWLDLEEPMAISLQEVMESSHSRFPVARGTLDECIVGLGTAAGEHDLVSLHPDCCRNSVPRSLDSLFCFGAIFVEIGRAHV